MNAAMQQRFQPNDACIQSDGYEFVGYVYDPPEPLSDLSEMEVWLVSGDVFPVIENPTENPRREC